MNLSLITGRIIAIIVWIAIDLSIILPVYSLENDQLKVATSISPISSLISELGGSSVQIETIITKVNDPHTYDLKPEKARILNAADIVVTVGRGFENWMAGVEPQKVISIESIIPADYELIQNNNHFWLDPFLVKLLIKKISIRLLELNPKLSSEYAARLDQLNNSIALLDHELTSEISDWRYKSYFCLHPAWSYFARHYGLKELGCLQYGHMQELGSKSMLALIKLANQQPSKIFFREIHEPLEMIEAFINDTDCKLVTLDALGSGNESYQNLIRQNVGLMADAMK